MRNLSYKLWRDVENERRHRIISLRKENPGLSEDKLKLIVKKEIKLPSLCSCGKFAGYSKEKDENGKQKRRSSIDIYLHLDKDAFLLEKTDKNWKHFSSAAHFSYEGVQHCGGSMICPVCGGIIAHKRQEEIIACSTKLLGEGYKYLFLTLTASHSKDMPLRYLVKKFREADTEFREHTSKYKNIIKKLGIDYYITASECTLCDPLYDGGINNGWHFHRHRVMFYKNELSFEEISSLCDRLSSFWVECLEKVGLSGKKEIAARFDFFEDAQDKAVKIIEENKITNYDKQIDIIIKYITKAMSFEMASKYTKKPGRQDRLDISALQILAAFDKRDIYFTLYKEYMKGIKGENFIRFSPGLKAYCGIEDKTDGELVEGKRGNILIHSFECDKSGMSDFFYIAKRGEQIHLKQILDIYVQAFDPDHILEHYEYSKVMDKSFFEKYKDVPEEYIKCDFKYQYFAESVTSILEKPISVAVNRALESRHIIDGRLWEKEDLYKFYPAEEKKMKKFYWEAMDRRDWGDREWIESEAWMNTAFESGLKVPVRSRCPVCEGGKVHWPRGQWTDLPFARRC